MKTIHTKIKKKHYQKCKKQEGRDTKNYKYKQNNAKPPDPCLSSQHSIVNNNSTELSKEYETLQHFYCGIPENFHPPLTFAISCLHFQNTVFMGMCDWNKLSKYTLRKQYLQ